MAALFTTLLVVMFVVAVWFTGYVVLRLYREHDQAHAHRDHH